MSIKNLTLKNLDTEETFEVNLSEVRYDSDADTSAYHDDSMGQKVTHWISGEDSDGNEFSIKYREYPECCYEYPVVDEGNFEIISCEFYNEFEEY